MMIFNVKLRIATYFDNLLLLLLLFDLIEYSCFVTTVDSRVNAKLLIHLYRISTTVTRNFGYKRDDDPSRVRLVRDEHKKNKIKIRRYIYSERDLNNNNVTSLTLCRNFGSQYYIRLFTQDMNDMNDSFSDWKSYKNGLFLYGYLNGTDYN